MYGTSLCQLKYWKFWKFLIFGLQNQKVETKQEIIEIKEKLISDIEKDNINKRLTLNLFKYKEFF